MSRREAPTRILIIRTDKVGDLVLTMPAIRAVRRAYPDAELTLLVSPYNAPVVEGWPVPQHVEHYDTAWPLDRRLSVARALRRRGFDLCLVFNPVLDAFIVARLTAASVRAGIVLARRVLDRLLAPLLLTDRHVSRVERAVERGESVDHEITQSRRLLERIDIPWAGDELELVRGAEAEAWADSQLGGRTDTSGARWIGLHLSEKWFDSAWTPDDLRRLFLELTRINGGGSRLVITHGPSDEAAVQRAFPHGFNQADGMLITSVDFPRLVSLTARCDVIVTRDTASLHVASAMRRPVVAVYAPDRFAANSQQFAPWHVPSVILQDGPFDRVAPAIISGVQTLLAARNEGVGL